MSPAVSDPPPPSKRKQAVRKLHAIQRRADTDESQSPGLLQRLPRHVLGVLSLGSLATLVGLVFQLFPLARPLAPPEISSAELFITFEKCNEPLSEAPSDQANQALASGISPE